MVVGAFAPELQKGYQKKYKGHVFEVKVSENVNALDVIAPDTQARQGHIRKQEADQLIQRVVSGEVERMECKFPAILSSVSFLLVQGRHDRHPGLIRLIKGTFTVT